MSQSDASNTFTYRGKLTPLNEMNNSNRTHWSAGARKKKTETEDVRLQAMSSKTFSAITEPCRIGFTWYYSSKHDFDNIRSCCKVLLDGMVASGKLPDDNQKWIKGFLYDDFVRVEKGEEAVVVEIRHEEEGMHVLRRNNT